MHVASGSRLGPYEIVARLGAGGMGEVWKARDTRLGRVVAIKILPSADPEHRRRFAREAKAIAALSHPHICTIHDVGEQDDTDYLVIEYLDGTTLAHRIERGPIDIEEVLEFARQIGQGLQAAHAAGVVHRDLKPANLFVTSRGEAKILDFGLAKVAEQKTDEESALALRETTPREAPLTTAGSVLGTVAYMSPEQARGEDIDARSDIFSFGAVLYEMTAGRPAFAGGTMAVIFDQVLNRMPPPEPLRRADVPPRMVTVIEKALAKQREDRYASVGEMLADLERVREEMDGGRAGHGEPASARPPEGRRARAFRPLALAALVFLMTLLLATALARRWMDGSASNRAIDSIAVLPFANDGGSPNGDYLSGGISETLTNDLTRIPGLRVVPRTLATRYGGDGEDPQEAAKALGVRAIVTGRVVQRGERLVVQAELIDAQTVAQLWGDRYDRPLADVLETQADLSQAIVSALRLHLTPDERKRVGSAPTRDAVAYQLYLKGRHAWRIRTASSLNEAIASFEQAIARDPSYADAYSGLADAWLAQAYWGYAPGDAIYPKAIDAARHALALEERTAAAHASLAWISLFVQWDWATAERHYQRAIALEPANPSILARYAEWLSTVGRHDEAIAHAKRAAALDPSSAEMLTHLGFVLGNARRFDEAIDVLLRARKLDPSFTLAQLDLARSYQLRGDYDLAIVESRAMVEREDPLGPAFLAVAYARAGRREEAAPLLEDVLRHARESRTDGLIAASVQVAHGDHDEAFRWLEKAYRDRSGFMPWIGIDPDFDDIRKDPRFADLERRVGIPTVR